MESSWSGETDVIDGWLRNAFLRQERRLPTPAIAQASGATQKCWGRGRRQHIRWTPDSSAKAIVESQFKSLLYSGLDRNHGHEYERNSLIPLLTRLMLARYIGTRDK